MKIILVALVLIVASSDLSVGSKIGFTFLGTSKGTEFRKN